MQSLSNKSFYATIFNLTVLITGLGYFVDTFDFFLYNSMRVASLTELGLSGDALTRMGIIILDCLAFGTLVGSVFWGILGDKIGRKKALLGSILVYSLAMIANAFIHDPISYAAVRFVVGFGIAGEIGLGATLVAETITDSRRSYALALFTVLGVLGVTAAALIVEFFNWRVCCAVGGVIGLLLLLLRFALFESQIYSQAAQTQIRRGSLRELFGNAANVKNYLCNIFILVPNFFVIGLLLTFSPEIAKATGVQGVVKANVPLALYFLVSVIGGMLSAFLAELFKSRRLVAGIFILSTFILAFVLVTTPHLEVWQFYGICAAFGLFNLWAVNSTMMVELFPTQLRATATTTNHNLARAVIIPITLSFLELKFLGVGNALLMIGGMLLCLGLLSVWNLPESYHRSLSA